MDRTCSLRSMLPHFSDQFRNGVPVAFAASLVEQLYILLCLCRAALMVAKAESQLGKRLENRGRGQSECVSYSHFACGGGADWKTTGQGLVFRTETRAHSMIKNMGIGLSGCRYR